MRRGSDTFRKQSSVGSGLGSVPSGTGRKASSPASGKKQRFDSSCSGEGPQNEQRMHRTSVAGQQGVPTFRKKSMAAGVLQPVDGQQRPSFAGPSLMGMIAGKKFAKKWASRFSTTRKASSVDSGQTWNSAPNGPRLEPTFRMQPHKKFNTKKVEAVIKDNLEERLSDFTYTPRLGPMMSKILSEEIKANVKALCFDRYKIIVSVTLGEKKNHGLWLSSRCTWDENLDSFATNVFENGQIFCSVTVYGVYFD
jgi:hypothetical protein